MKLRSVGVSSMLDMRAYPTSWQVVMVVPSFYKRVLACF